MLDQLSLIVSGQQTGTDAAQFERASLEQSKQSSLASTLMGIDNVASVFGGRGETIGVTAHYTGSGSAYSDEMSNIMGIDLSNAKEAALNYFTRKNAMVLILDPLEDDEIDVSGEKSSYVGSSQGDTVLSGGEYYKNLTSEEIASAYISPDE